MEEFNFNAPVSRRRAFTLAGLMAGGVMAARAGVSLAWNGQAASPEEGSTSSSSLPIDQIESILQTQGTVSHDVLMIEQDRTDLQVSGPSGVPFLPPFALDNTFAFQRCQTARQ